MADERLAYSVDEFSNLVGISRRAVYLEVAAGRLRIVKCGKRTLITSDDARVWLDSLPEPERQSA